MSYFDPSAQQGIEWDDPFAWPYWFDQFSTTPETLNSFDAGPNGRGGYMHVHLENREIGSGVLLTEQTQGVPVNPTTPYSQTLVLASAPCSSSPIPPVAGSNVPTFSRRRTPRKALKCAVPECEDLTFTRPSDLHRHTQNKHHGSQAKRFVCYAVGCFNKESPCAFARPDKLTSHIKSVHRYDRIFTRCPVRDCALRPSTLEALGVHIRRTHMSIQGARAVMNASSCKVYRCPAWSCGKQMPVSSITQHIESGHSLAEVSQRIDELFADGFIVNELSGRTDFTISVRCPVCKSGCGTIQDFTEHLWTKHLFLHSSDGAEHFTQWRDELVRCVDLEWSSKVGKVTPWHRFGRQEAYINNIIKTFKCPACPFSASKVSGYAESPKNDLVRNHHLSLLRAEDDVVGELFLFRFQILRLYPDFATHPVFSDLGPIHED